MHSQAEFDGIWCEKSGWKRAVISQYCFELICWIKRRRWIYYSILIGVIIQVQARQTITAVEKGLVSCGSFSLITIVIPAGSLRFCLEFHNLSLESELLVNWIFFLFSLLPFLSAKKEEMGDLLTEVKHTHTQTHARAT